MHRFYVEGCGSSGKSIVITGEDVNHIKNVLRLSCGDEITINDCEKRDYICRISSINCDSVAADIEDVQSNAAELATRIILFQGIPKADKLEFIIQKAVELGVTEIVPVMTKRSVVKLDKKREERKLERYNAIALSAAKQSGRGIVPRVREFMNFGQALKIAGTLEMNLIPYEEAEGIAYAREMIHAVRGKESLGIFIGPEGGFAREEVDAATKIGAKCITLGSRILRTETAGLAVLSVLMFELEE